MIYLVIQVHTTHVEYSFEQTTEILYVRTQLGSCCIQRKFASNGEVEGGASLKVSVVKNWWSVDFETCELLVRESHAATTITV